MPNATRKPLPTIGVSMYTYFPVMKDDKDGTTYGTAVSLPGTTQISPSDTGGNAVFDADDGAYESVAYLENIGHELTNADVPPKVDADWRGLTQAENGLVTVADTKTPYFGVAWRVQKSDGSYRYVRYYKGSYAFASNVGGQTKPSTGAPEFQTATVTFTAVKRDSDGAYYAYIDEADFPEGVTRETFETEWFSDMDYAPEGTSAGVGG